MGNQKTLLQIVVFVLAVSGCIASPATTAAIEPSVTPISLITITPSPTTIPTATSTPIPPTATGTGVPEEGILYHEDFEDEKVVGWAFDGSTWTITQEENGNHYWQGIAAVDYAHANYDPSKRWTDLVLEARVRFTTSGDKAISMIVRNSPAGAYVVGLTADGYIQMALSDPTGYKVLQEANHPFTPSQWYLARVELQGDELRLYVDNSLVTSVKDGNLQSGSISMMLYGSDPIDVDNMRVWSLTP